MKFIKKYNTYIFIALVAVLTVVDIINWSALSTVRKLVNLFAVLAALHEIEEKVWPGGFYELMLNKFGMKTSEVDLGRGTLIVSIYWVILLGSAYIFDDYPFLLAITITLSFFEALIHTAGIKLHHLKKPYTPGLVTALCLAIAGIYSVYRLNTEGIIAGTDYILGVVLWLVSFICMDILIISGFGKKPSELIAMIKNKNK